MERKPRRTGRRIAIGIVGFLVLAIGGYGIAHSLLKPDPAKLTAWSSDLDQALEEARKTNKLVLVKTGSQY